LGLRHQDSVSALRSLYRGKVGLAGVAQIAEEEPGIQGALGVAGQAIFKNCPTILLGSILWGGSGHSGEWKEAFRQVAQLLQKTEVAEQVVNDYYTRLDAEMLNPATKLHTSMDKYIWQ
jgi:hypothetical protein